MRRQAIFLGYRRADTGDVVGRVYDALTYAFGEREVFRDVDSIPMGAEFAAHIRKLLPKCRVFLAFIGPNWLDAQDEHGQRRIDNPDDLVRVEIAMALATPGLLVVPVLVNGARMPSEHELPADIDGLARRHAAIMRADPDFRNDIGRLTDALRDHLRTGRLNLQSLGGAAQVTANAAGLSALAMAALLAVSGVGVTASVPQLREPVISATVAALDAASDGLAAVSGSASPAPVAEAPIHERQASATPSPADQVPEQRAEASTRATFAATPRAQPSNSAGGQGDAAAAIRELDRVGAREWVSGLTTPITLNLDDLRAAAGIDPRAAYLMWQERGRTVMDVEVFDHLARAARGGLPIAQGDACQQYRVLSHSGVTEREALIFCESAADADNFVGLYQMYRNYRGGLLGLDRDLARACTYYARAVSVEFPADPGRLARVRAEWRRQTEVDPNENNCGAFY